MLCINRVYFGITPDLYSASFRKERAGRAASDVSRETDRAGKRRGAGGRAGDGHAGQRGSKARPKGLRDPNGVGSKAQGKRSAAQPWVTVSLAAGPEGTQHIRPTVPFVCGPYRA